MPQLFTALRMVWVISRYFNDDQHMMVLLERCADEVEPGYAECKASELCAMRELEDDAYKACLADVRRDARPPAGWPPARHQFWACA